eukprot:COSAG05_NODE_2784_length_2641_cov_2.159323_2_plen_55_part_00
MIQLAHACMDDELIRCTRVRYEFKLALRFLGVALNERQLSTIMACTTRAPIAHL